MPDLGPMCCCTCMQIEGELKELNRSCCEKLAAKQKPVRHQLATAQRELLLGYQTALGASPPNHESLYSLRAVGCFQAGLYQQVCSQLLPKYTACIDHKWMRWLWFTLVASAFTV